MFLKGEIGLYSLLFVALAFRNGLQYRHSDFQQFICDDLAISCKNLVNFGPVTSKLLPKMYIPSLLCHVGYMLGYATHF